MKKYAKILKYSLGSAASWAVDNGLFLLLKTLIGDWAGLYADSICVITARLFSSFFNFNVNNRMVFQNQGNYGRALLRYYCLAAPVALCSAGLVTLADRLLGITEPTLSTLVKIVIDTVLFFLTYFIQKKWVFSSPENKSEDDRR